MASRWCPGCVAGLARGPRASSALPLPRRAALVSAPRGCQRRRGEQLRQGCPQAAQLPEKLMSSWSLPGQGTEEHNASHLN